MQVVLREDGEKDDVEVDSGGGNGRSSAKNSVLILMV